MAKTKEIVDRAHLFRVELPDSAVWDFMKEYGSNFGLIDGPEGVRIFQQVHGYYVNPSGAAIEVIVYKKDETRFREFLDSFFTEKGLGPVCTA
jgi:hypothetical protein